MAPSSRYKTFWRQERQLHASPDADETGCASEFLASISCDARLQQRIYSIVPFGQSVNEGPSAGAPDRLTTLNSVLCWPVGVAAFSYAEIRSPGTVVCPSWALNPRSVSSSSSAATPRLDRLVSAALGPEEGLQERCWERPSRELGAGGEMPSWVVECRGSDCSEGWTMLELSVGLNCMEILERMG